MNKQTAKNYIKHICVITTKQHLCYNHQTTFVLLPPNNKQAKSQTTKKLRKENQNYRKLKIKNHQTPLKNYFHKKNNTTKKKNYFYKKLILYLKICVTLIFFHTVCT